MLKLNQYLNTECLKIGKQMKIQIAKQLRVDLTSC